MALPDPQCLRGPELYRKKHAIDIGSAGSFGNDSRDSPAGLLRAPDRESASRQLHLFNSAASKALPIACLLLPARAASPITVTICPGRASSLNCAAVARRPR